MGKIQMGILGPLSQSVGNVTGASIKGRATLRRKSSGGVNPRTDKQVASRSSFAEASDYCRENKAAIQELMHFKEVKGKTIWNQMVSWYLAGGRLEPVSRDYEDITYNSLAVKHLLTWTGIYQSGVIHVGMPLASLGIGDDDVVGLEIVSIGVGSSITELTLPLGMTIQDGVLIPQKQNNSETYLVGPGGAGMQFVYKISYQNSTSNESESVYVLVNADDCQDDLSGNAPGRNYADFDELMNGMATGDSATGVFTFATYASASLEEGDNSLYGLGVILEVFGLYPDLKLYGGYMGYPNGPLDYHLMMVPDADDYSAAIVSGVDAMDMIAWIKAMCPYIRFEVPYCDPSFGYIGCVRISIENDDYNSEVRESNRFYPTFGSVSPITTYNRTIGVDEGIKTTYPTLNASHADTELQVESWSAQTFAFDSSKFGDGASMSCLVNGVESDVATFKVVQDGSNIRLKLANKTTGQPIFPSGTSAFITILFPIYIAGYNRPAPFKWMLETGASISD